MLNFVKHVCDLIQVLFRFDVDSDQDAYSDSDCIQIGFRYQCRTPFGFVSKLDSESDFDSDSESCCIRFGFSIQFQFASFKY